MSNLTELEHRLGADWLHLTKARSLAQAKRKRLCSALQRIDSEDTSVVVLGSLARDESTAGSDIDCILLVDGSADPKHLELVRKVEQIVSQVASKKPGREGTFGTLSFSHELVHRIGGDDDTNRNTTRRILLLLESEVLGRRDAYDRVVRNVLQPYVCEDRGFVRHTGPRHIPRFLLNDFARCW